MLGLPTMLPVGAPVKAAQLQHHAPSSTRAHAARTCPALRSHPLYELHRTPAQSKISLHARSQEVCTEYVAETVARCLRAGVGGSGLGVVGQQGRRTETGQEQGAGSQRGTRQGEEGADGGGLRANGRQRKLMHHDVHEAEGDQHGVEGDHKEVAAAAPATATARALPCAPDRCGAGAGGGLAQPPAAPRHPQLFLISTYVIGKEKILLEV